MGASASVNAVFEEAATWFRDYFDESTYIEDFQSIDKNNDGTVTFAELKMWIAIKARREGGPWKQLLDKPEVYKIAHIQTSQRFAEKANDEVRSQIFGITEFRTFLIYLFMISILSVHFRSADSWEDGGDAGNDSLSLDEFKLASRSFCNTREQERLRDDELKRDFDALDGNGDGMVSFVELCNYFCTNFEKDLLATNATINRTGSGSVRLSSHFGEGSGKNVKDQVGAGVKTSEALNAIESEMHKSKKIANLTEIKLSTEIAIGHSHLISPEAQQKLIQSIETDMLTRQGSGKGKPFNPDSRQSSATGSVIGARDSPVGPLPDIGEYHAAEDADTSISVRPSSGLLDDSGKKGNGDKSENALSSSAPAVAAAAPAAASSASSVSPTVPGGDEKKTENFTAAAASVPTLDISPTPGLGPGTGPEDTAVAAVENTTVFESPRVAAAAAAAAGTGVEDTGSTASATVAEDGADVSASSKNSGVSAGAYHHEKHEQGTTEPPGSNEV